MAQIQVKALKMGYVGVKRIREGSVFFMDEKFMKKDEKGKAILPHWVEAINEAKGKKSASVKEAEIIEETDDVI